MNQKLLTDETLRNDIYTEMMFTAGAVGYYKLNPEQIAEMDVKEMIEMQIDYLMPVIKRHIKRHKKAAQPQSTKQESNNK